MNSTRRLTLLGSALLAAVALAPVAAEASSAPTQAQTVTIPQDAYSRGHASGYRQGMRDGRADCMGGRHRRTHFNPPSMGTTRYSRGFATGYRSGYSHMCG
jgi:hypothetical protein